MLTLDLSHLTVNIDAELFNIWIFIELHFTDASQNCPLTDVSGIGSNIL